MGPWLLIRASLELVYEVMFLKVAHPELLRPPGRFLQALVRQGRWHYTEDDTHQCHQIAMKGIINPVPMKAPNLSARARRLVVVKLKGRCYVEKRKKLRSTLLLD